ncbi:MAG TPA: DUF4153 domain-containing protein [Gemmatimonadales bacterium]|nr:DUF4153 domain-containing protein [Gemmatimonadales bacterium]
MKTLPTLGVVLSAAQRAARRFPLVLACGVIAAITGILLVDNHSEEAPYIRLLTAATLGLPLLFALTLTGERRFAPGDARRWVVQGIGVAVLVAFWAAWPHWPEPVQVARYFELSVSFHLLAAFLPYAGIDEPNGFWHYNKALIIRFVMAGVFAAVLFGGLSLALAALDKLLGVDVPNEAYGRLWMLMAFVFTTWFFVGGVPDDLAALEHERDYPAVLRVFAQYVLVPIVVIYLVILTLYLGKVLIERQWPSGWIGFLVSSVATAGILAWLLVWPLEDTGHRWVRTYTRGFYIAILPAIVMLWLAIGKRVAQYGVTERRYFMIVLSLWWAGIAIYYTLGKSRNIKVIPASLCVLGLLTFLGPWGAYRMSLASQRGRLDHLVAQYGLRPSASPHEVPFDDRKEIAATLRYLLERGDGKAIAARFGGSAAAKPVDVESRVRSIMASLGVAYVNRWQGSEDTETLSLSSNVEKTPIRIAGYTYLLHLSPETLGDSLAIEPGTFLSYRKGQNAFRVTTNGRPVLDIPLQPLFDRAEAFRQKGGDSRVPIAMLRAEAVAGSAAGELYFTYLFASKQSGEWVMSSYTGELFLRLR